MISYIKGELEYVGENYIIIDNNGIGYNIQVSPLTLSRLTQKGSQVKIYTHMNVKEDELSLFGFMGMEELDMFHRLITVSGVGPKGALSILSAISPSQVALAIITDDVKSLCSGQGIGKKTAQRIVLELKDKIKTAEALTDNSIPNITEGINIETGEQQEAIEGLLALGFGRSEAVTAVNKIEDKDIGAGELIREALKILSK